MEPLGKAVELAILRKGLFGSHLSIARPNRPLQSIASSTALPDVITEAAEGVVPVSTRARAPSADVAVQKNRFSCDIVCWRIVASGEIISLAVLAARSVGDWKLETGED